VLYVRLSVLEAVDLKVLGYIAKHLHDIYIFDTSLFATAAGEA